MLSIVKSVAVEKKKNSSFSSCCLIFFSLILMCYSFERIKDKTVERQNIEKNVRGRVMRTVASKNIAFTGQFNP